MSLYPSQQIKDELIRTGKLEWVNEVGGSYRYNPKDVKSIERKWKANAHPPTGGWTFCDILMQCSTPWGKPQNVYEIVPGIYGVSTARHGGLWISDEWKRKLPKEYQPYTRNRRWAEEDCDWAIVLQYFGLLSLISEPLEVEILSVDIEKGHESRQPYGYSDEGYYGGPLTEAYQRQTGDTYEKMTCTKDMMNPTPGGFKIAKLSDAAVDFMTRFDAGESVQPTKVVINPYIYPLPQDFNFYLVDGNVNTVQISGYSAEKILDGDLKELEWQISDRVVKVTHKSKTIWER